MSNPLQWIDDELRRLDEVSLRRRLALREGPVGPTVHFDGRELICFASNDYLALAGDERLVEAATASARREGAGSGASPLICGHYGVLAELERELAELEGTEAALVFPSGFAANLGTIAALVGPGDLVLTDRKNHASLLDGCRLSRADVRAFRHADADQLDRLLRRRADKPGRRLVVTDSLFSMDGDVAPLADLCEVCERHGAMLMIDEAHATGVFGAGARGVAEYLGVEERVTVRVGTLSKALGAAGGFVAGSRKLIEWLVNRARPYIFSTAMPPAVAGAAAEAVRIVRRQPGRGAELLRCASDLRARLAGRGWSTGRSASQIIPVVMGTPDRALALSSRLRAAGLLVPAIRPPTVPEGEACLRISLTAGHSKQQIERLLAALDESGPAEAVS